MPEIRQLDKHVSELIAAGEVVERPASVVKELLENAIDAGASAITVELQDGGLTFIRITDNGCGIAPEQLPTAFLRHATSKLRRAADLNAIGTLGFRGEALAAISAVSRVDIFSRERGAAEGARLHLEGGVPEEVLPAGCPEGTTICVRDLFYNTPGRMKFMKKDAAEATAIAGIVTHLSLSHADISFRLLRDGREVLHTPGDGELLNAVYAAMGRDFALSLLPAAGRGGQVAAAGFVTKPLACHGTRARQTFFVNGRYVKNQLLTAAVEEAYRNQLMKGRFPGCVLHITLPAGEVDVNVHPAKTVVKFVSDKSVFDAVYHTVLDALNAEKKPPRQEPAPAPKKEDFYRAMTVEQYRGRAPRTPEPAEKRPLGSFTAAPTGGKSPLAVRDSAPAGEGPFSAPAPAGRTYVVTPPAAPAQAAPAREELPLPEERPTAPGAAPAKEPEREPVQEPVQESVQETLEPLREPPWRIVGEVLRTYIICEDAEDNVWLIDKHAAHERLRFDALKARREPPMSQPLLVPLTVSLEAEEYAAALDNLDTVAAFGFACEDFGPGTLLVREVPCDIRAEDAAATVEELARKLALGRADPAAARDELLHTMACKSAIRAGMTTDPAEMRALVDKVQAGEILYCPHGRPVKQRWSRYEIEKLFKRA